MSILCGRCHVCPQVPPPPWPPAYTHPFALYRARHARTAAALRRLQNFRLLCCDGPTPLLRNSPTLPLQSRQADSSSITTTCLAGKCPFATKQLNFMLPRFQFPRLYINPSSSSLSCQPPSATDLPVVSRVWSLQQRAHSNPLLFDPSMNFDAVLSGCAMHLSLISCVQY